MTSLEERFSLSSVLRVEEKELRVNLVVSLPVPDVPVVWTVVVTLRLWSIGDEDALLGITPVSPSFFLTMRI